MKKDFQALKSGLENNHCSICHQDISDINQNHPCFHWLINPNVKKKLLGKLLLNGFGFIRLYGYLTWVANSNKLFFNINDLSDSDISKLFESTIRYKGFEWSFSLGKTDFEGHKGSHTEYPHFHFQMKKDGHTVIKFNDYHVPFSSHDLLMMEMMRQDAMVHIPGYEAEINALSELTSSEFIDVIKRSDSETTASMRTQTLIEVPQEYTEEVTRRFNNLRQSTDWTAPKIVEYLNKEFGYGIRYVTMSFPIDPLEKSRRK